MGRVPAVSMAFRNYQPTRTALVVIHTPRETGLHEISGLSVDTDYGARRSNPRKYSRVQGRNPDGGYDRKARSIFAAACQIRDSELRPLSVRVTTRPDHRAPDDRGGLAGKVPLSEKRNSYRPPLRQRRKARGEVGPRWLRHGTLRRVWLLSRVQSKIAWRCQQHAYVHWKCSSYGTRRRGAGSATVQG